MMSEPQSVRYIKVRLQLRLRSDSKRRVSSMVGTQAFTTLNSHRAVKLLVVHNIEYSTQGIQQCNISIVQSTSEAVLTGNIHNSFTSKCNSDTTKCQPLFIDTRSSEYVTSIQCITDNINATVYSTTINKV